jgi:DNA-binding LacI/PurR family transcriptional regulator
VTSKSTPVPPTHRAHARRHGKVTIRQVAAAAGVSRATASRVISGSTLVSSEARAAVQAAISELGFVPSPAARSLALGRTNSVALVLPEPNSRVLSDPFFAYVILGLSGALDTNDKQMVLLIARSGQRTERIFDYLAGGHVDGAIVASHHRDDTLNQRLVELDLPCVFIGRPLHVGQGHYVDMDNVAGARLATEHLVSIGRTRIATIGGPADMSAGVDRVSGWRAALDKVGLDATRVIASDFTQPGGELAMRQLTASHPDIDAVFAASDLMAAGALDELSRQGRRVPDDVAVMGFDDFPLAATMRPPLSTVAHPVDEMARQAGQMLLHMIDGTDPDPDPLMFSPRLTLRQSA